MTSLNLIVCTPTAYTRGPEGRGMPARHFQQQLMILGALSHICPYFFQTELEHKEQLQLHKCVASLCVTAVTVLQFWPEETSQQQKNI